MRVNEVKPYIFHDLNLIHSEGLFTEMPVDDETKAHLFCSILAEYLNNPDMRDKVKYHIDKLRERALDPIYEEKL